MNPVGYALRHEFNETELSHIPRYVQCNSDGTLSGNQQTTWTSTCLKVQYINLTNESEKWEKGKQTINIIKTHKALLKKRYQRWQFLFTWCLECPHVSSFHTHLIHDHLNHYTHSKRSTWAVCSPSFARYTARYFSIFSHFPEVTLCICTSITGEISHDIFHGET